MMRWAEISKGFVSIITVSETEEFGADWLNETVGGEWLYIPEESVAEIGYVYDNKLQAFIPPQPFNSWTLNEETFLWESPIPYPSDSEGIYQWDESSINWILVQS